MPRHTASLSTTTAVRNAVAGRRLSGAAAPGHGLVIVPKEVVYPGLLGG